VLTQRSNSTRRYCVSCVKEKTGVKLAIATLTTPSYNTVVMSYDTPYPGDSLTQSMGCLNSKERTLHSRVWLQWPSGGTKSLVLALLLQLVLALLRLLAPQLLFELHLTLPLVSSSWEYTLQTTCMFIVRESESHFIIAVLFATCSLHASRITLHASRITYHAARITLHASRITHHASRIPGAKCKFCPPVGMRYVCRQYHASPAF